jgi:hypothetical protein
MIVIADTSPLNYLVLIGEALPSALDRLRQTSFRAPPSLLQSFLERDAKRNKRS